MSGPRGEEPIPYEFYDVACDERDSLRAENHRLRDALERSDRALRLLLARKPLRDAAETLAETSAALERWSK